MREVHEYWTYSRHPNYLGEIEDVESLSNLIHKKNGLLVQHTYPTSLGLLKPPGKLNVDISK